MEMAESKYLLNRDARESARFAPLNRSKSSQFSNSLRLIEQHDWLKRLLGCNIHPTIPTNTPGLRVADVATGTAIWLLDLAKMLPSDTQLYGFDISTAQFPAPEARPSNVFLYEQSVTRPFLEEYHGFFDIVAVRLITAGLRGEDWDAAVKNLNVLLSLSNLQTYRWPDNN
jgi:hypothetical protein